MPKNAPISDDEDTKMPRSVTPIPSTIEHIKGFPKKLIIFKVASSSFWWTRCHYEGKPYKRSTKTESKRDAIKYAKDFYEQLITNKRVGVSSNACRFKTRLLMPRYARPDAPLRGCGSMSPDQGRTQGATPASRDAMMVFVTAA